MKLTQSKIVVCGDSFCTSWIWDKHHFSQILADTYGYDVTNLAHNGFSNVGICFQIQHAIKMGPDVVIYNTTDAGRFEMVMNGNFNSRNGLRNMVYCSDSTSSYSNPDTGDTKSPIFSSNYSGIKHVKNVEITQSQIDAVEQYMKHFFDYGLKTETESWMIGYWHQQIITAGIIPIRLSRQDNIANPMYSYAEANPECTAGYHTDIDTQAIMAQSIDQELKVLFERRQK
jgi:hypothetical protein